ncbi:2-oxo acid dehydrogenase subunit E2 [Nocardioides sp. Y6]|uniref:Dihydrolipoamide acetyltransferase component of pyruvate dehydrogenase complex n=1 Tax=Nocardioides malaquae TaxID=2773426 RepID=A0ABR9RW95_9ACTN|nr:dihydrolipoamide acetyltransferase family protein [Nocardioides malaquae]MBE7325829.1 2-oxo acid dehydrogenase subunit E2 [Nocardioides malaquae]
MAEFLLPDVGEGLTEAEIVEWRVQVGDVVEVNDLLVDIETAKSIVELPSPFAGTVLALLVEVGQTVPVGEPIIAIGDPAEPAAGTAADDEAQKQSGQKQSAEKQPADGGASDAEPMEIDLSNPAASGGSSGESLVGRTKADRGPVRRPRTGSASPSTLAGAATQMQVQGAFAPGGAQSQEVVSAEEPVVPARPLPPTAEPAQEGSRPRARPRVRAMAKELGVDLASVRPNGDDGLVTAEEVLAAAGLTASSGTSTASYGGSHPVPRPYDATAVPPPAAPPASSSSDPRDRREPVKGVRRMMAQAMTSSAFTVPHVTEWVTLDVTRSLRYLERLRQRPEYADVKVTPMLLLARACMLAMKRTPEVNSFFDAEAGESGEVVLKDYVNLGVAAATPRGLVVPNVKDAHRMRMLELARALQQLTATAKEGRTQPAEQAGGTFTITNIGVFGIDAGTPIINPGEAAILAFGAITKRPWVDEESGEVVARDVTTLALSFDHRHVDGAAGSRFLADVAAIMRDPANALQF